MRSFTQLLIFSACAQCGMAFTCQDVLCAHRCTADKFDGDSFCKPNCDKGTGKCLSGKVMTGSINDMPQCLNPGTKDSKGKDDKKSTDKSADKKTMSATCDLNSAIKHSQAFTATYKVSVAGTDIGNVFAGTGGGPTGSETGAIVGAMPSGAGPFPLFMWFPGTGICPAHAMPQYMVQQMVNRGFASVAVEYPDKDSYFHLPAKAETVAGSNEESPLSKMCAHAKVDCSLGVAVGGYSQGTHIAALAATVSDNVTAAYMIAGGRPTGKGAHTLCDDVNIGSKIPKSKRRYIVGEKDNYFAWLTDVTKGGVCTNASNAMSNLKIASGYDCLKADCIQADGSGYYVATAKADACGVSPDHYNWMETVAKTEQASKPSAWFKPINDASLDWLAQAAKGTASKNFWTTPTCPKKEDTKKEDTKKEDTKKETTSTSAGSSTSSGKTGSSRPVIPHVLATVFLATSATFHP